MPTKLITTHDLGSILSLMVSAQDKKTHPKIDLGMTKSTQIEAYLWQILDSTATMQAEHWPWKDPELAERPNGNLGGENDWTGVRSTDRSDVGERKRAARQVLHTTRSKISLKMPCLIKRCNTVPVHVNGLFAIKIKIIFRKVTKPAAKSGTAFLQKATESNCYRMDQLFPREINSTYITNLFNKNDWTAYESEYGIYNSNNGSGSYLTIIYREKPRTNKRRTLTYPYAGLVRYGYEKGGGANLYPIAEMNLIKRKGAEPHGWWP